jgi:hypothetical protein
VRRAL